MLIYLCYGGPFLVRLFVYRKLLKILYTLIQ